MVLILLEMQQFGGSNADAIKEALGSLFKKPSKFATKEDQYMKFIVSCTAGGASVNMGKYSGVLTQMKNERPWLLTIHCSNHRIELTVKSAFDIHAFKDVEDYLLSWHMRISANVRSKISVLLNKFRSYQFPSYVNLYLDLLDCMVPLLLAPQILRLNDHLALSATYFPINVYLSLTVL